MTSPDASATVLRQLQATIRRRQQEGDVAASHTAQLLAAGPERCARKLGEEGVEAALACAAGTRAELVGEAADLIYHLLVALASRDVSLEEVTAELERRQGRSGITEKAERSKR